MSTGGEQDRVYEAVAARGYTDGWSREQFAARQVAKLVEELGELSQHIDGHNLGWSRMRAHLETAAMYARNAFDYRPNWIGAEVKDIGAVIHELADVQVVVFCLATAMRLDVAEAAVEKAEADVERGVR